MEQQGKGPVSRVECYLLLEHLDLGEILNDMPGTTLGPNNSIKLYSTYRHFETYGECHQGKWN